MRWTAARNPDVLAIGVDANADGLRETSRRLAAKPARGGLANAMLGRLSLQDAPGELAGMADRLTVLLPWGSLLRAVALPDEPALRALRALCKPDAQARFLFGYGPQTDGAVIDELALPSLDVPAAGLTLEACYRRAGLAVRARAVQLDEVRELPTTWAGRLAFSGHRRSFIELRGRAHSSLAAYVES